MRISTTLRREGVVVKLEGRLAGPWVREAERVWRSAADRAVPVTVDLSDVTYADRTGRELLAAIHAHGTRLAATTLLTRAIVEEIAGMREAAPCGSAGGCDDRGRIADRK